MLHENYEVFVCLHKKHKEENSLLDYCFEEDSLRALPQGELTQFYKCCRHLFKDEKTQDKRTILLCKIKKSLPHARVINRSFYDHLAKLFIEFADDEQANQYDDIDALGNTELYDYKKSLETAFSSSNPQEVDYVEREYRNLDKKPFDNYGDASLYQQILEAELGKIGPSPYMVIKAIELGANPGVYKFKDKVEIFTSSVKINSQDTEFKKDQVTRIFDHIKTSA